jgi:CheY-like chemotaxis protein
VNKNARVLVVEDDPLISRYVEMALEDLDAGLEVVCVGSVPQALLTLEREAFGLIITDLMLPGDSGLVLLDRLHMQPELHPAALTVVYSAGLDEEAARHATAAGAWRLLPKPASVQELQDCVREALCLEVGAEKVSQPGAASSLERELSAVELEAVGRHFAGDADLFLMYRASCLEQFASDRAHGDAALARSDLPELRRLVHSLVTVLQSIGCAAESDLARRIERAAQASDGPAAAAGWSELRGRLSSNPD